MSVLREMAEALSKQPDGSLLYTPPFRMKGACRVCGVEISAERMAERGTCYVHDTGAGWGPDRGR